MWYEGSTYAKDHGETLYTTHIGRFKIALLGVSTLRWERNKDVSLLTTPTRYRSLIFSIGI